MSYNHYSRGGKPHPMHLQAEALRRHGQGEDKILAHINPEEARYLKRHNGMDINPHTGLPQFGKHRKFGFFGPSRKRSGEARTESIFEQGRRHHPILGALGDVAIAGLGTALGGPAGGIAASAMKGGLDKGLKGIPGGVAKGMAYNAFAPSVGEFFGVNPHGMMGRVTGLNSPSLLHQFGVLDAPPGGGGLGLFGNSGYQGLFNSSKQLPALGSKIEHGVETIAGNEDKGWIGKMLGKASDSIMSNPLDSALLAMTVAGTLGSKSKIPKEPSISEHVESLNIASDPRDAYRKVKPSNRQYIQPPADYDPGIHGEHLYFGPEEEPQYYADGGSVTDQTGNSGVQSQNNAQPQQQVPGQLPIPGVMTNQNPLMASRGVISAPVDQSSSIPHPSFDVGNYVQTMMGLPVPGQTSTAGTPSQPAQQPQSTRQDNSQQDNSGNPVQKAKRGGSFASGGPVRGATGGQADVRPDRIKPGSYILNATDISLLGDGNTDNGMHKAHKMVDRFMRSGITKDYMQEHANHRDIDVMLSDGEYKIPAEVVTAIGKGNNSKGAKIIDKGRKKLRKQKGVKAILPPKAKDLMNYFK